MPPSTTLHTANRAAMSTEREQQMLQAAKLYYQLDLTQTAIARRMNLTRWTVGRLLKDAKAQGIVRIEIVSNNTRRTDLEGELQRRHRLDDVVVVPTSDHEERTITQALARAGADYLAALRPELLAISWGRTMAALASYVPTGWNPDFHVVMVNGATSRSTSMVNGTRVAEDLAAAGPGTATLLPVPAILGERATREALECDPVIADVLDMARKADVACFSLGGMSTGSVLVQSGYLSDSDVDRLAADGAVGDCIGRFIDIDGVVVDPALDGRTLGLTLAEIANKNQCIVVAGGTAKHPVVRAALNGRLLDVLITDDATAAALLENT